MLKKKIRRRFFLKDISFVFIVSFVFYNLNKTFINKKRKEIYIDNELIKKNYYFAKKTYRTETVQIIFKSYFNGNINANLIMNNIKNRRKLNEELYSNNIQILWRRV